MVIITIFTKTDSKSCKEASKTSFKHTTPTTKTRSSPRPGVSLRVKIDFLEIWRQKQFQYILHVFLLLVATVFWGNFSYVLRSRSSCFFLALSLASGRLHICKSSIALRRHSRPSVGWFSAKYEFAFLSFNLYKSLVWSSSPMASSQSRMARYKRYG